MGRGSGGGEGQSGREEEEEQEAPLPPLTGHEEHLVPVGRTQGSRRVGQEAGLAQGFRALPALQQQLSGVTLLPWGTLPAPPRAGACEAALGKPAALRAPSDSTRWVGSPAPPPLRPYLPLRSTGPSASGWAAPRCRRSRSARGGAARGGTVRLQARLGKRHAVREAVAKEEPPEVPPRRAPCTARERGF